MSVLLAKDFMYRVSIWYHVAVKKPNFKEERKLWNKGIKYIIGIDEVGRGAFAGPIVAGAVVFPQIGRIGKKLVFLKQINDSKLIKAKARRKLAKRIKKSSLFYAVAEVDIQTINRLGIGRANQMVIRKVARKVIAQLKSSNNFIICDGLKIPLLKNHTSIINGDCKSISIAAASIIAKVHRDALMRDYSKKFHHYKFARNKGYGTKGHQEALKRYGLTRIHRTSFELNKFLSQQL